MLHWIWLHTVEQTLCLCMLQSASVIAVAVLLVKLLTSFIMAYKTLVVKHSPCHHTFILISHTWRKSYCVVCFSDK